MTPQEEAIALQKLNLGMANAILSEKPNSPLSALLLALAQDVTEQLRVSADKYNISASSNLKQSIIPKNKVTIENGAVTVAIEADFYWKFVNYGVNGTEINRGAPAWGVQPKQDMSFHQAILNWIPTTGTTLPEGFSSYDSWAWAIQTNIKKHGQKARPFFTDVVNKKLVQELKKPIELLLKQAITVNIVDPWQ